MNRNFALWYLGLARPSNGADVHRSLGATILVLVVAAAVIAAIAVPFISG